MAERLADSAVIGGRKRVCPWCGKTLMLRRTRGSDGTWYRVRKHTNIQGETCEGTYDDDANNWYRPDAN